MLSESFTSVIMVGKAARSLYFRTVGSTVYCKSARLLRSGRGMDFIFLFQLIFMCTCGTHLIGKRDVKVKALETAEAAKRLEEKKENERKMRKEALKLERAKLEEKNLKLMELEKKRREEERKKKDADIISKKRLREVEERKEKEKKKMRLEVRQQQREQQEKMRAEKAEKENQRTKVVFSSR